MRNALFTMVTGPALQAIVAFGVNAHHAVDLWDAKPVVPVVKVPHPSSRAPGRLLAAWAAAVTQLRGVVTADPDGDAAAPNYGTSFEERDYARIPPGDLPFGVPDWFGDDSWGRQAQPRHNNSVERPGSDLRHTLIWKAPHDRP